MTNDGPPANRHLQPVYDEPPYDPAYDQHAAYETSPTTDRQTHADRDAEQAILATLVLAPETGTHLAEHLDGTHLYWPVHEQIWDAWHHLHQTDGVPPDAIVLAAHLRTSGHTDAAATIPTLLGLNALPSAAPAYAKIVRDHARLRAVAAIGNTLTQLARTGTVDTIDHTLAEALDRLDETAMLFNGPGHNTTTSQWAPLNLDTVLAGEEVDPPPTICARTDGNHLFYAGAIHTVSGEPGSGKTWLTLEAALQELRQGHLVTMVDFEDRASRVTGRLLGLGATPTQIREQFRYIRPHTALDPTTDKAALQTAITGNTLVILDGVTEAMTLHGLDLNANADVANFYALLPRWIADHGPAVVMIDHVVKDGEKQGRWALGGQHKLAGIDGVAYLVKAIEPFGRGKTGLARITVSKDRPGYVEEIALGRTVAELRLDARDINYLTATLDPPSALPVDDAGDMRPTRLMEKTSRYVEANPGANRTQITETVTGKTTYVRRALDRLIQEGYVEVSLGKNREKTHRVTTPFREDDDAMHERPGWAAQEQLS